MLVMRRAFSLVATCIALVAWAACASVLGVDKTYTLGAADAGTSEGGSSEGDGGGATSGIRCAQGGTACTAGPQECCEASNGSLSCISASGGCNQGTDIFCDEPSQCGGQACCISLQTQGSDLLGTVCMASCPSPQIALCARPNGTCAGGLQCKPLTVGAPFGSDWFYGCQ
jgi:hypothetical protein